MGEGLGFFMGKVILLILTAIGIIFHLLVLRSPETGRRVEEKLGKELGVKKKFIPWLEENRMRFHETLIKSKAYSIFAVLFLIFLLIFLLQIKSL